MMLSPQLDKIDGGKAHTLNLDVDLLLYVSKLVFKGGCTTWEGFFWELIPSSRSVWKLVFCCFLSADKIMMLSPQLDKIDGGKAHALNLDVDLLLYVSKLVFKGGCTTWEGLFWELNSL